jgi:hypothetical protein
MGHLSNVVLPKGLYFYMYRSVKLAYKILTHVVDHE